jgi:tetratricopeptide (TPR) repeat protein
MQEQDLGDAEALKVTAGVITDTLKHQHEQLEQQEGMTTTTTSTTSTSSATASNSISGGEKQTAPPGTTASEMKEHGNAAFKAGDYTTAAAAYSAALLRERTAAVTAATLLSNRAACALSLGRGKLPAAVADASAAVLLDRDSVKGHYRRAKGLMQLGMLVEAEEACGLGLSLKPGQLELLEIQERLVTLVEHAPAAGAGAAAGGGGGGDRGAGKGKSEVSCGKRDGSTGSNRSSRIGAKGSTATDSHGSGGSKGSSRSSSSKETRSGTGSKHTGDHVDNANPTPEWLPDRKGKSSSSSTAAGLSPVSPLTTVYTSSM